MQPERSNLDSNFSWGWVSFSWGLEQRTPLSTSIARRQIDDCDYVVILLGSQYGEQSVSGVGYMHLEYIYAITKQKPLIVFMHEDPDITWCHVLHDHKSELREKFKEFRKQLQHEVDQVFTYRTLRDLETGCTFEYATNVRALSVRRLGCARKIRKFYKMKLTVSRAKVKQLETEVKWEVDPIATFPKVSMHEIYSFEYRYACLSRWQF